MQRLRASLPAPAVVTVTCLPHHGPREAVGTAVDLAAVGYTVIPHLAARSVADRAELGRYVALCRDAGIADVFVIGGDAATAAGPYAWSGALMEDIADLSGGTLGMGVAVYPEGHPGTAEDELARTLRAKQGLASWCVTQLCFSPDTLHAYPPGSGSPAIDLPVWAGVPGPVRVARLLRLMRQHRRGTVPRLPAPLGRMGARPARWCGSSSPRRPTIRRRSWPRSTAPATRGCTCTASTTSRDSRPPG